MTTITRYGLIGALLVAICLGVLAFHYQNKATGLEKDNTTLTGERDVAQFTLGNYTTSVRLFNDIAKASDHEKRRVISESEIRITAIKKDISADECATRSVPVAAAERLRKHANQIRSGATGTDTSKLTF
ncbi:phage exported protein [Yersinia pseudotuberculosis]|uniref:hypothetical protein n=1 Tax=Yersinia pseudotuberculosis TaxID=633 RepID=UPI0005E0C006|nr:hypothetical protein [Yersinia pseudotuberculosis]CNK58879.1 phage exported protein [Yersinia pseudotuberculosis]